MKKPRHKQLLLLVLLSLAGHLLLCSMVPSGGFRFTRPLAAGTAMELHLDQLELRAVKAAPPQTGRVRPKQSASGTSEKAPASAIRRTSSRISPAPWAGAERKLPEAGFPAADPRQGAADTKAIAAAGENTVETVREASVAGDPEKEGGAARGAATRRFTGRREKLSYVISMFGFAVGSAVLETRLEGEDFRITSTIRSNSVTAGIYPVEDTAETRVVAGNYIIARIRQREGEFLSDTGFTLALQEKKVFWYDSLHKLAQTGALEDDRVTDLLSAFHLLRRESLEVGKTVRLHTFDSNRAVVTPVDILRKERVRLGNLKEVDAVVVRPALQTAGPFTRTGEILIWLTDDENRVPVRLETSITLGPVTAVLVSAESDRDGAPPSGAVVGAPSDDTTAAGERLTWTQHRTP